MFEGLRFQHWQIDLDADGIATVTLDRAESTVNALSRAVLEEFDRLIERLSFEPPRGVVIRSGKPAGFVVGADLKEFAGYEKSGTVLDRIREGQAVFERLARLRCPTAVAIHGHCMGGGTELALACDYRIASDDPSTRIGLPEVKLGIFPGWGGSARLPRLIGAPEAMAFMLTGRSASAKQAQAIGLVDAVTTAERLTETAKDWLRRRPSRPIGQRALAWATNLWPVRQVLAPILRKRTAAKARPEHYPAPFALIETWRRGGPGIRQRLELEARAVARLAQTPTCRQLIRVFFLQERLKAQAAGTQAGIERIHVVGAGVMGGDIAAWAALRGFEVSLQDRSDEQVGPAIERGRALFAKKLKSPDRIEAASARLRADVGGGGVAAADLVIEAIFENLDAKQALYRELEPRMKPDALLASNTSSIPLDELRTAVATPGRFLGLHYFNPVALMPLVEIVRHDALDATAIGRAAALCKRLDKLPIVVAGTPGFLVNRVLMPYLLEAIRILREGVPGPVIDKAAKRFGMPMGPIELADTVGLDVCASVGKELAPFLGLELPDGIESLLEAGHRGKKSGQGFYVWENGRPVKPEVDPRYATPADLEDRLILPMLNEAVACLHDRVVEDADLLDAGVIFGTGFAPFRGGPIQYVRDTGADVLQARLTALAARHGSRFAARPGWDLFASPR